MQSKKFKIVVCVAAEADPGVVRSNPQKWNKCKYFDHKIPYFSREKKNLLNNNIN